MTGPTRIEGAPYSAEFLPVLTSEEYALAYGVVRPPFDLRRASMLIEQGCLPDDKIEDFATTQSATVLEMSMDLDDKTQEETLTLIYGDLRSIVETLNSIENGTFKQDLREGE